jgi:hypothetical protein
LQIFSVLLHRILVFWLFCYLRGGIQLQAPRTDQSTL